MRIVSFICFLLFVSICFALDTVIWNSGDDTVLGQFNYNDPSYGADARLTLGGVSYSSKAQASAYNYATSTLTLMVTYPDSSVAFVTVDCARWSLIAVKKVEPGNDWAGLQYDQTSNQNSLLGVGLANGLLYISRINPVTGDVNVWAKLQGILKSTAFVKSSQTFVVTINTPAGVTAVYMFDSAGQITKNLEPTFAKVPEGYLFQSGPYITTYVPTYNAVISLINFKKGDQFYDNFAYFAPSQAAFSISTMSIDVSAEKVIMVADQTGQEYLYAIAKRSDGVYNFYVYNLATASMFKRQTINTPVLAMF
ncbi:hypothetical protein CYY_005868 [Polysphondylium violaceum]|uniref:DOMON domain-containing protein n=1 Tax=Polysphondylium violaceum TaxID=133409 RepID=A0A8J4UYI3_9MYCE|nr:hypothetical protein CYY_005868 [Polysphondylium violaceum]